MKRKELQDKSMGAFRIFWNKNLKTEFAKRFAIVFVSVAITSVVWMVFSTFSAITLPFRNKAEIGKIHRVLEEQGKINDQKLDTKSFEQYVNDHSKEFGFMKESIKNIEIYQRMMIDWAITGKMSRPESYLTPTSKGDSNELTDNGIIKK